MRCSIGELWTPKVAQIFAYGKCLRTHTRLLHGASDLDQRRLKTRHSAQGFGFWGSERYSYKFWDSEFSDFFFQPTRDDVGPTWARS